MNKNLCPAYFLILVTALFAGPANAALGPDLAPGRFWVDTDHPRLEEMDPKMLERLAALGIVQQLREYPDSPIYEATTITLIHAPIEKAWEMLLDMENRPKIVPEMYNSCQVVEQKPDEIITMETFRIQVPPFSWNMQGSHHYRIDHENYRADFEMIAGDVKGSNGRLTLIPTSNEDAIIAIFRHYGEMREIDLIARLFLKYSPQFSLPAILAEGVALVRGLRREAEAGLNVPYRKPMPWIKVGPDILEAMSEHRLYIHQEKEDGTPLCTAAAWKIQAPVNEVWKVVTDFEQWDKYQSQVGVKNRILSRQENQVKLIQKLSYKVFYIFGINLEIKYEYNLRHPNQILFHSPDPDYPGSHGEWNLKPAEKGRAAYLVVSANIYIQKASGAAKMFGEAENPMPVREAQNMIGVQILGAPIVEQITKNREEGQ